MSIGTLTVERLKVVSGIIGKAYLPRLSAEVRAELKAKIQAEGAIEPLTVWAQEIAVVDGVERLDIYKELGIIECPCSLLDFKDEKEAAMYRAKANFARRHLNLWQRCRVAVELLILPNSKKRKNGEGSAWADAQKLSGAGLEALQRTEFILRNIDGLYSSDKAKEDLAALDADEKTIHRVYNDLKGMTNSNFRPSDGKSKETNDNGPFLNGKPKAKKHGKYDKPSYIDSIVCLDRVDGLQDVPNERATIYVTSVPYLGSGYDYEGTFNDGMTYDEYLKFLRETFAEVYRVLRPGGTAWINVDAMTSREDEREEYYRHPIYADVVNLMRDFGMCFFGDLVWFKSHAPGRKSATGAPGAIRIRRNHEYVLGFSKGKQFLDNERGGKIDLLQDELNKWTLSVWQFGPERKHRDTCNHPATFPMELPHRLIKLYSFQGDLVIDSFCGTGTTCEAAKRLNRHYYGIDIVPSYVKYAKERLAAVK